MKVRVLAATVAIVGLLVLAVAAMGKTTDYKGPIAHGGILRFKLTQKHGTLHLRNGFSFSGLRVQCSNGRQHTSGHLTFPIDVKQRRFTATAQTPHNAAFLQLKGHFSSNLKKAAGTIEVKGKKVHLDGGGHAKCHSGVRNFVVKRG
jgi:hypothetical protein